MEVLTPDQQTEWSHILEHSYQHDFYHRPEYHRLAEDMGEGAAHLLALRADRYTIALPLLVRSIGQAPGLEESARHSTDCTSVYGYAGPVFSHENVPSDVVMTFQTEVSKWLSDMRVVAVFSRLHPLIEQERVLRGLGQIDTLGPTASLDLTLSADQQNSHIRKGYRYDIRKLRRDGVNCHHDPECGRLGAFIDIYRETMRRVGASDGYFFEAEYFERLASGLGAILHLFYCTLAGEIICAGLFTLCDGIIQYHLSGSKGEYRAAAPSKLMLDSVRLWGTDQGARRFHLGGGVGSKEDSLFRFKAGFSSNTHAFKIWRWVVQPDVYNRLCTARSEGLAAKGIEPPSSDYFPAYRTPAEE